MCLCVWAHIILDLRLTHIITCWRSCENSLSPWLLFRNGLHLAESSQSFVARLNPFNGFESSKKFELNKTMDKPQVTQVGPFQLTWFPLVPSSCFISIGPLLFLVWCRRRLSSGSSVPMASMRKPSTVSHSPTQLPRPGLLYRNKNRSKMIKGYQRWTTARLRVLH